MAWKVFSTSIFQNRRERGWQNWYHSSTLSSLYIIRKSWENNRNVIARWSLMSSISYTATNELFSFGFVVLTDEYPVKVKYMVELDTTWELIKQKLLNYSYLVIMSILLKQSTFFIRPLHERELIKQKLINSNSYLKLIFLMQKDGVHFRKLKTVE